MANVRKRKIVKTPLQKLLEEGPNDIKQGEKQLDNRTKQLDNLILKRSEELKGKKDGNALREKLELIQIAQARLDVFEKMRSMPGFREKYTEKARQMQAALNRLRG